MHRAAKMGLAAALALALGVSVEAADVNQSAVLPGKVVSVAAVNAPVKEGDVLVTVESLVGPVPAARADTDGVVKQVLVKAGDTIQKQDVVVVIASK